jgi:hypothetical protein
MSLPKIPLRHSILHREILGNRSGQQLQTTTTTLSAARVIAV